MTEQMHTPLKPCPFCGGAVSLRNGGPGCFFVQCDTCNATGDDRAKDSAIATWNARAPAASSQERIAQLEAWARDDLAIGLAGLDGVTLRQINATVGDPQDATNWREYLGRADDLLAHLSLAASAAALGAQPLAPEPEGWKLVPIEPMPEMLGAWYRYKSGFHFHDEPPPPDTSDYGAYRAMLAAAPERIVGAAK